MISKWLEDLAADFWELAGEESPFPRDLEHLIHTTKPVTAIHLAQLRPQAVRDWLAWRRFPIDIEAADRPLNGCLIARQERGFLFVEESLPPDDERLIVAHEFAHFLADYEFPRTRACRRVGPGLLSVFDGPRQATPAERSNSGGGGPRCPRALHGANRNGNVYRAGQPGRTDGQ